MRIYLDDERETPVGWERTLSAGQTIEWLKLLKGQVTELSLDHDLGLDPAVGNGYDVLLWLEQNPEYAPEYINIHSANPAVWKRMHQAIDSIHRRRLAK